MHSLASYSNMMQYGNYLKNIHVFQTWWHTRIFFTNKFDHGCAMAEAVASPLSLDLSGSSPVQLSGASNTTELQLELKGGLKLEDPVLLVEMVLGFIWIWRKNKKDVFLWNSCCLLNSTSTRWNSWILGCRMSMVDGISMNYRDITGQIWCSSTHLMNSWPLLWQQTASNFLRWSRSEFLQFNHFLSRPDSKILDESPSRRCFRISPAWSYAFRCDLPQLFDTTTAQWEALSFCWGRVGSWCSWCFMSHFASDMEKWPATTHFVGGAEPRPRQLPFCHLCESLNNFFHTWQPLNSLRFGSQMHLDFHRCCAAGFPCGHGTSPAVWPKPVPARSEARQWFSQSFLESHRHNWGCVVVSKHIKKTHQRFIYLNIADFWSINAWWLAPIKKTWPAEVFYGMQPGEEWASIKAPSRLNWNCAPVFPDEPFGSIWASCGVYQKAFLGQILDPNIFTWQNAFKEQQWSGGAVHFDGSGRADGGPLFPNTACGGSVGLHRGQWNSGLLGIRGEGRYVFFFLTGMAIWTKLKTFICYFTTVQVNFSPTNWTSCFFNSETWTAKGRPNLSFFWTFNCLRTPLLSTLSEFLLKTAGGSLLVCPPLVSCPPDQVALVPTPTRTVATTWSSKWSFQRPWAMWKVGEQAPKSMS